MEQRKRNCRVGATKKGRACQKEAREKEKAQLICQFQQKMLSQAASRTVQKTSKFRKSHSSKQAG